MIPPMAPFVRCRYDFVGKHVFRHRRRTKQSVVDMNAMHARSEIERQVKYYRDRSEVPNRKLYWIAWVTVETGENGPITTAWRQAN